MLRESQSHKVELPTKEFDGESENLSLLEIDEDNFFIELQLSGLYIKYMFKLNIPFIFRRIQCVSQTTI